MPPQQHRGHHQEHRQGNKENGDRLPEIQELFLDSTWAAHFAQAAHCVKLRHAFAADSDLSTTSGAAPCWSATGL